MTRRAKLIPRGAGRGPDGDGWFVLSAAEAAWVNGPYGAWTPFEGEDRFAMFGINLQVLAPGQANCLYHGESEQEDFLVLDGEALLLVEEEERRLRRWDFVHCPAWTDHVFVGAGEHGCLMLAAGSRTGPSVLYPVSDLARRHGAGVEHQTDQPDVAYAPAAPDLPVPFDPRWLRSR